MEAFQELYEKYHQDIYYFVLKMVYYRADLAEELTQETFYQVYLSFHRFKGQSAIKTWICQIAKNVCCKYYKKNPIHMALDDEILKSDILKELAEDPAEIIENREMAREVLHDILQMKKQSRDIFILKLYFEQSFEEIGKLLNMKISTVKTMYYREKETLKKRWEEKS